MENIPLGPIAQRLGLFLRAKGDIQPTDNQLAVLYCLARGYLQVSSWDVDPESRVARGRINMAGIPFDLNFEKPWAITYRETAGDGSSFSVTEIPFPPKAGMRFRGTPPQPAESQRLSTQALSTSIGTPENQSGTRARDNTPPMMLAFDDDKLKWRKLLRLGSDGTHPRLESLQVNGGDNAGSQEDVIAAEYLERHLSQVHLNTQQSASYCASLVQHQVQVFGGRLKASYAYQSVALAHGFATWHAMKASLESKPGHAESADPDPEEPVMV